MPFQEPRQAGEHKGVPAGGQGALPEDWHMYNRNSLAGQDSLLFPLRMLHHCDKDS